MTDYARDIGGGTSLMIRDFENGTVEFWIKTGASTFNSQQHWGYSVGGYNPGTLTYALARGGNWQRMGSRYYGDIGGDYDIMMSIQSSGLGFPSYSFTVHVSRARAPDPPVPPFIYGVGDTWIDFGWGGDGGWGGASITYREFYWSTDNVIRNGIFNGGARMTLPNLVSGGTYYIWARNGNAAGLSAFSAPTIVRTLRVPDAPSPVTFGTVEQASVDVALGFDGRWDGGTPIREWQFGYGLDPNTPQLFTAGPNASISGLSPGQKYYFWARGRNDIGWGPWSIRSEVQLHAGAYVNVSGVSHSALVWLKVNGVWRLTIPWVKLGDTWRTTS